MERVFFRNGGQREFLKAAIRKLNSPSLRGLLQFGLRVNYSTLKNYFVESRILPKDLFLDICLLCGFNPKDFDVEFISGRWGQVKGGRARRKT
ncbi:hypothetical protein D6829_02640 [Candidatus Pacearchaeota archaeon]|nr:MAG: hypothetical protein D6829_02640 [Candidatus Pacearchaeota archaeon]